MKRATNMIRAVKGRMTAAYRTMTGTAKEAVRGTAATRGMAAVCDTCVGTFPAAVVGADGRRSVTGRTPHPSRTRPPTPRRTLNLLQT